MKPVIAVDLGATNIRVAQVYGEGIIRKKVTTHTPAFPMVPEDISSHIIDTIHSIVPESRISRFEGIGISVAGPVDSCRGIVVHPPNISLPEIPLVDPIHEKFGLPVRLINDCPAGAIGELYFGAGKGCRNFVYITISTGIGGGVIAGGKILLGRQGNAAEIGHFHVDNRYNLICGCGSPGHWEAYASGRHLPEFFSRWCLENGINLPQEEVSSPSDIFDLGRADHPHLDIFIEELGRINGRGISNVIVAYDPARIILDGSVIRNNPDLILPPLLRHVDRFLPLPQIIMSRLEGLAPLLGASIIARGYDTTAGSLLAWDSAGDCT